MVIILLWAKVHAKCFIGTKNLPAFTIRYTIIMAQTLISYPVFKY